MITWSDWIDAQPQSYPGYDEWLESRGLRRSNRNASQFIREYMEKIEIQVKSLCCGNEEIYMRFDEVKFSFYASCLGQEPISSLVQAVYELEEEGFYNMDSDELKYESEIRWLSEPGYLKMMFNRKNDILHIHLDTADDFENKTIMVEELHFSVPFKTFKEAVISESLRVLRKYGIRGYYKSWSEDFPLGMLFSILGCSSEQENMGNFTSSLSVECKFLNEYNQ